MKLKPHQILQYLGFDIGEEGIEINEYDAFLHKESLKCLGDSITLDNIKDEKLLNIHNGMANIVAMHKNQEPIPAGEESSDKIRALIRENWLKSQSENK